MELKDLNGIGKKTLEALNLNNIYTTSDLAMHFPTSYNVYEIHNELLFSRVETCFSGVIVTRPYFIKYRRNVNSVIFYMMINNIKMKCILFGGDYLRYQIKVNKEVVIYGHYHDINQEILVKEIFFENFATKVEACYNIKNVNDYIIKKAVLDLLGQTVFSETLPLDLINKYRLLRMNDYLLKSHNPLDSNDYKEVIRRRKYEEFYFYALSLELLRYKNRNTSKEPRLINEEEVNDFIDSLSYRLTPDQLNAISVIKNEIKSNTPMNRLIQGDVGCGKSIISVIATLMEVLAGYQVSIMLPTEILAIQTYNNFKELLFKYGINVELLTSSTKKSSKDDIIYRLSNNRVHVIVGTHALIEDNVQFYKLGLAIIDEQHKFGVAQRNKLVTKFKDIDSLYMTATPIPRTLGLSTFGDLDITSIHTMPSGRLEIKTRSIDYTKIDELAEFINRHLLLNEQCYIVVPMVNDNEDFDAISVDEAYKEFSTKLNREIGIVHGKMKAIDKNNIMDRFKRGELQVLISTTVIEVGVNVPRATIMVVLDANHFGLSQIHQLRGRVGRGNLQSYCILVSKCPNLDRLQALVKYSSGFDISNEDFKLRGPGDYLGSSQSGHVSLSYSDFIEDIKIWECAKNDAKEYLPKYLDGSVRSKAFDSILSVNNQFEKIN